MSDRKAAGKPAARMRAGAHAPPPDSIEQVIAGWLEAAVAAETRRREALLDRAVRDTFPASDPVAPESAGDGVEQVFAVDCRMDNERLTLVVRAVSPTSTRIETTPARAFEQPGPGGMPLRVSVFDDADTPTEVPAPGRSSEHEPVDAPDASAKLRGNPGTGGTQGAGGKPASSTDRPARTDIDWPAVERRLGERRRLA